MVDISGERLKISEVSWVLLENRSSRLRDCAKRVPVRLVSGKRRSLSAGCLSIVLGGKRVADECEQLILWDSQLLNTGEDVLAVNFCGES